MVRILSVAAVVIACTTIGSAASSGPCDSPWALDYRYQPGFSEFGVQGRTLDLALYHAGRCVLDNDTRLGYDTGPFDRQQIGLRRRLAVAHIIRCDEHARDSKASVL